MNTTSLPNKEEQQTEGEMNTKVLKINSTPRKTNSSYGNYALDAVVEHTYNNERKAIMNEVLYFWTAKKANEVYNGHSNAI